MAVKRKKEAGQERWIEMTRRNGSRRAEADGPVGENQEVQYKGALLEVAREARRNDDWVYAKEGEESRESGSQKNVLVVRKEGRSDGH